MLPVQGYGHSQPETAHVEESRRTVRSYWTPSDGVSLSMMIATQPSDGATQVCCPVAQLILGVAEALHAELAGALQSVVAW
jgi:hypothetical protein